MLLALLFIIASYTTQTRNILLGEIISIVFLLAYWFGWVRLIRFKAVLLLNLFVVALIFSLPYFSSQFTGYFDSLSLRIRMDNVSSIFYEFFYRANLYNMLFCHGIVQSSEGEYYERIIFDVTVLNYYLYAGLLGVAIYVVVVFSILRKICHLTYYSLKSDSKNPLLGALFSFSSSYLVISSINIYITKFFVCLFFISFLYQVEDQGGND
jgi:hypothetical protein